MDADADAAVRGDDEEAVVGREFEPDHVGIGRPAAGVAAQPAVAAQAVGGRERARGGIAAEGEQAVLRGRAARVDGAAVVRDGDGPRHRVRQPLAAELEADAGRAALTGRRRPVRPSRANWNRPPFPSEPT